MGIAPRYAAESRADVVIAVNELPRGLEAAADTGNVDVRATYSIFDTLLRRHFSVAGGGNASLKPSLAESWKRVSPMVLEVRLRKGVRFHNGDDALWQGKSFSPNGYQLPSFGLMYNAGRHALGQHRRRLAARPLRPDPAESLDRP